MIALNFSFLICTMGIPCCWWEQMRKSNASGTEMGDAALVCPVFVGVFLSCPQWECLCCQPQRWVVPLWGRNMQASLSHDAVQTWYPGTNRISFTSHLLPTVHSESWGPGSASSKIVPLAATQILPWAVTNKQRETVSQDVGLCLYELGHEQTPACFSLQ